MLSSPKLHLCLSLTSKNFRNGSVEMKFRFHFISISFSLRHKLSNKKLPLSDPSSKTVPDIGKNRYSLESELRKNF